MFPVDVSSGCFRCMFLWPWKRFCVAGEKKWCKINQEPLLFRPSVSKVGADVEVCYRLTGFFPLDSAESLVLFNVLWCNSISPLRGHLSFRVPEYSDSALKCFAPNLDFYAMPSGSASIWSSDSSLRNGWTSLMEPTLFSVSAAHQSVTAVPDQSFFPSVM